MFQSGTICSFFKSGAISLYLFNALFDFQIVKTPFLNTSTLLGISSTPVLICFIISHETLMGSKSMWPPGEVHNFYETETASELHDITRVMNDVHNMLELEESCVCRIYYCYLSLIPANNHLVAGEPAFHYSLPSAWQLRTEADKHLSTLTVPCVVAQTYLVHLPF